MRARRFPVSVLLPVGLLALLVSLAALQYRWLGQVSAAERDELSRSLEHRAREFADDFDREIGRAYLAFQLGDQPVDPARPETLQKRLASWLAVARFPDIIRAVYLSRSNDAGGPTLERFDADGPTLESVTWPAHLEPVRERLAPQMSRTTSGTGAGAVARQVLTFTASALVRDVPALIVPLVNHTPPSGGPAGSIQRLERQPADVLSLAMSHDVLIVDLDRDHLTRVVLPALIERHFGDEDAGRYRISIVDGAGQPLQARGLADGATIDEADADVTARFFGLRLDLARPGDTSGASVLAWRTEAETRTVQLTPTPGRAPVPGGSLSIVVGRAAGGRFDVNTRFVTSGWQLLVQHSAGSLGAAVAQARTRNLWLSFGILSVLTAAVGLLVLNARRSERLAAQQMDFVATVSHELRTPLAVIRSAAQNLQAGVVHDSDQARRYGTLIESEGRRLTDMVEQVLEFAGLSGNRGLRRAAPIDPGELVRDAMAGTVELCREQGVELEVQTAPDLPLVEADEDAVRRALGNLVANALKYAADGRWIGVTVARAGGPRAPEVRIAVSDRGRGIDADELAHIFEPFYRGRYATERQIHGNGLGLSLVRRIAEAHGGRVTAASTPGQGTTFTLHLPGVEPDRSVQPLGQPAADAGPRT
jgi:signal transduction histidine kinase